MTYARFLGLFLLPPIVLLGMLTRRSLDGKTLRALAALVGVSVVYTAPWDNLIVLNGVWTWDPRKVTGRTLGVVPLEEYAFFVLQTLATGLLTAWVTRR